MKRAFSQPLHLECVFAEPSRRLLLRFTSFICALCCEAKTPKILQWSLKSTKQELPSTSAPIQLLLRRGMKWRHQRESKVCCWRVCCEPAGKCPVFLLSASKVCIPTSPQFTDISVNQNQSRRKCRLFFFFMRVTFPSPKTPRLSARAVPTVLNEANFTLRWTIHVEKSTKEFSYWLEEKRSRCKAPNVMTFLTVDSVSAALLQTDCAADKLNYISIYYLYIYYLSVWFSASFLYFYTTDI